MRAMAIDGIFLSLLRREIEPLCGAARVDKIHQPAKETLILTLRCAGGGKKLLLSASSQTPRLHLTRGSYENPAAPPMFCMLLRKHLSGARLTEIRQISLDRILLLCFENRNELGDMLTLKLAVEIMGRHSNIILLNEQDKIIDSIKRVDPTQSSVRQVLPGLAYELPPAQDKLDLLAAGARAVCQKILSFSTLPLHKAAMAAMMGISPVVANEISGYVSRAGTDTVANLSPDECDRLGFFISGLQERVIAGGVPTMLCTRLGAPKDVSFIPLTQYEGLMTTCSYPSYCELLDSFYAERDLSERIRQRSGDLFRFLANLSERIERKMQAQGEELEQSRGRERLRRQADLINANLYRLKKGDTSAVLENFYEEGAPVVEIPLDARLTPAQNAQRYYAEYRKADTAERMLNEQLLKAQSEHRYLDTVMDNLLRAACEAELDSIREELRAGGYLRKSTGKVQRPQKLEPVAYRSSDGFLILQGRGNLQNDKLTMKDAKKEDIWFHTQNIPGSHVVVVTGGKTPPDRTLEEAAMIAAYQSKAKGSPLVPVDYTEIRNVRKPSGAKPGFVLYVNYKTAIVTPDEALLERLKAASES